MKFDTAFDNVIGFEGGYTNHPADPGGETIWGITKAVANENGYTGPMAAMSRDFAKAIYKVKYWDAVRADELPDVLKYPVFDAAVNSGPKQSIKWLQRAVGEQEDGSLGPKTMASVNAMSTDAILRRMLAQRLLFMAALPAWEPFGKGWARRVAMLLLAAS